MERVPITIAHRGDPHAARENTMAAFEAAMRQGADMVEIDLRRTRDGAIVVLHDPTLERLWNVQRAVADMDLADVETVGQPDQCVPRLETVLEQVQCPLMIDFTTDDVVAGAVELVRQVGALSRALFVSGNVGALRQLRSLEPAARLGLTWITPGAIPGDLLTELDAEYWNPMFLLVDADKVAAVHDLGRHVSTWTVDKRRDMKRMVAAGVDAIVSNRIGALRRTVAA
jgi:glycerophosphoryl diester phosphodiesterase